MTGESTGGNRVEGSVVGGDSLQIGRVDGDVTVLTGMPPRASAPEAVPEGFWTAPGPATPAHRRLGLLPVREADPIRLGVHRPIRPVGSQVPRMPAYVPRDLDEPAHGGLRPLVDAAARTGGFVLLVGGSSVGKTRSLYEAVRDRLPDWWLLHPSGARDIEQLVGLAPRRLVIWLDELQNYLDGEHGLTAATVRSLLAPGHQVLVVATLWPHYYDAYTAQPRSAKDEDRHPFERELLKQADTVRVATGFSAAERERAEGMAEADERLRTALASKDFGLTQVIAGAPQLVHRWESADAYARAVLTAAADLTLLGAQSPIPGELLRAAVPGYCTPEERAGAPADWFEAALEYTTRPQLGATSPLVPVNDGQTMGGPDGYRVADYLVQHTGPRRRVVPPETFWTACAERLTGTADAIRIGASAVARQRFAAAVPLLRRAARAGEPSAIHQLAELYRTMGDTEGAEEMAALLAASPDSSAPLYQVLLAGWDFEEIFDLALAGNEYAIDHLIEYGDEELAIDLLRARMEPDDLGSWYRLATLLHEVGEDEQAIAILEMLLAREYDADGDLLMFLTELLQHGGHVERLYELTEEGYFFAAHYLAVLLNERGEGPQALDILREFAGQGHMDVDDLLAELLAEHECVDELLDRAADGDPRSAVKAVELLRGRGEVERAAALLRPLADAGDAYASSTLAKLLGRDRSADELRARVAAGDEWAAEALAKLLLRGGELEEAVRVAKLSISSLLADDLVQELVERGRAELAVAFLEEKAASGEGFWTGRLAKLLKAQGRADELRIRIDMGDTGAAEALAALLEEQGRQQEARSLRTYGMTVDGRIARGR
ncbi:hypothetical protein [Streptomyces melanogenes]|uniref:hypothetical protein n=1 Tax=Streptomyces melanogenes TaxID=67326 RepID=UPI0019CD1DD3|nr:hypothetical protein [Streptomyces melanogenes]GGP61530.1 hypothetical protein GCM10010278_43440 [Streptomyces melanogenes]